MKAGSLSLDLKLVPTLDLSVLKSLVASLESEADSAAADEFGESFDRITLPSLAPARREGDSWVFEGRVARVHTPLSPLLYENEKTKGWVAKHRDAAELARIVEQLPGLKVAAPPQAPVHHPEMLTDPKGVPTNVEHRVVGEVLSARLDGEFAIAEIRIDDSETLAAIQDGTRELSLGYWSRLDKQKYQRDTRLDHLAIVPYARCGETCQLRTDGFVDADLDGVCACHGAAQKRSLAPRQGCACQHANDVPQNQGTGTGPEETTMDELQKKLDAALADAAALKAAKDAAEKERDEARLSAHEAKKDAASAKERAEAAEKAVEDAKVQAQKDADEQFEARLDSRVELIGEATPILGKSLKVGDKEVAISKLDERTIMTAVVKHVDGEDVSEKESIDYLKGMYRSALRTASKSSASRANVRQAIQGNRDAAPKAPTRSSFRDEEEKAKAAMNKDTSTRWSTKKGR